MELKTDLNGVYRQDSGALINKNNSALIEYKRKKQEASKMNKLEKQIEELLKDVNYLKEIVKNISNESKV